MLETLLLVYMCIGIGWGLHTLLEEYIFAKMSIDGKLRWKGVVLAVVLWPWMIYQEIRYL